MYLELFIVQCIIQFSKVTYFEQANNSKLKFPFNQVLSATAGYLLVQLSDKTTHTIYIKQRDLSSGLWGDNLHHSFRSESK